MFLGDSLTEGVGSSRACYVDELTALLRGSGDSPRAVHLMRMRGVEPQTFNRYIPTNLAGFFDPGEPDSDRALWIWNLASEGTTIESDLQWLPWLRNLNPERVFIYRGSFESIIRPAAIRDGFWPWWVPGAWRGLVSMDPRCYFSSTWYRHVKQAAVDALKQRARLRLLLTRPGRPSLDPDVLLDHYTTLLRSLSGVTASVHLLGLIGPDDACFPGSSSHFASLNGRLRALAYAHDAEFVDWAQVISSAHAHSPWRYRDGFHPNKVGAQILGAILRDHLAGHQ